MQFLLILGHGNLGAIKKTVECIRQATPFLKILVILNEFGAEYRELLTQSELLLSKWVNVNHKELTKQVIEKLQEVSGQDNVSVVGIVNFQDFMWPCFLDLCDAFPEAKQHPKKEIILSTAIKPNLRLKTKNTKYNVNYVILPLKDIQADNPYTNTRLHNLACNYEKLIVKPLMGGAGGGVSKVASNDISQLKAAAELAIEFSKGIYGEKTNSYLSYFGNEVELTSSVLIEEYIDGMEYSIEGIADEQGIPRFVIQQLKGASLEEPYFKDLEYIVRYSKNIDPIIFEAISELLVLTEYRNRAFHIELKVNTRGEVKPIEFNPRPGGGSIMQLVHRIHGVDMVTVPLCAFLNSFKTIESYFVTRVIQPYKSGKIESYMGLEDVIDQPDCCSFDIIIPQGTYVESISTESYLIEFCVYGEDLKETRKRAEYLAGLIEVNII